MITDQIPTNASLRDYLERTTKSKSLFERAKRVYPSGSTRAPYYYSPYPVYVKKGEGCFVWDIDGNKYLDFTNNMGPLILGHRHPVVQEAISRQLEEFWCGSPTELDVKLAETILKAFPMADRLLFTPSGTEADMKLIRAARAYTKRKGILMSTGSYHGTSDSAMPGPGVPEEVIQLRGLFRYNDEESFRTSFHKMKHDLAAVILEAVLGEAGSVPPTKSFLRTVREETETYGVPFILDEVVTGFRIRRGGISELYGIEPDGIALGKIIGGGLPIGAFLGSRELMKDFEHAPSSFPLIGKPKISHGGTFNAHPISMAAGLATLNLLNDETYEHLERFGTRVRSSLSRLCYELGIPHQITGIGSIFKLHFCSSEINNYESAKCSDEKKGRIFDSLMLARGVFLPFFHSSFCSVPMGNSELEQVEKVAEKALLETTELSK